MLKNFKQGYSLFQLILKIYSAGEEVSEKYSKGITLSRSESLLFWTYSIFSLMCVLTVGITAVVICGVLWDSFNFYFKEFKYFISWNLSLGEILESSLALMAVFSATYYASTQKKIAAKNLYLEQYNRLFEAYKESLCALIKVADELDAKIAYSQEHNGDRVYFYPEANLMNVLSNFEALFYWLPESKRGILDEIFKNLSSSLKENINCISEQNTITGQISSSSVLMDGVWSISLNQIENASLKLDNLIKPLLLELQKSIHNGKQGKSFR